VCVCVCVCVLVVLELECWTHYGTINVKHLTERTVIVFA